jgi:ABC-type glutathione transport system ATPase component
MDVRQRTEEIERLTLAPWATFSDASRGRVKPEEQDPIRPVFQRDRDRIIHCKAFRRLKQKTQVFLSPEGDLYRTRLTHTLEVAQIARTIARALRLNEDLTEAISLAHDLGHTPFGHAGESALDKLCPEGFRHYMQSLRVVDKLENGWDSDVGEGGDRLSTGEKQLISFARAVLADPRIFVLDEATSSIDTQTEQLIQNAIDHLLTNRTSFLVAHRLSTIRKADVILVVKDGHIVEQGKHEELLRRKGYYHDLYSKQFAQESAARILGEGSAQ